MLQERKVVTCFLESDGEVLILRRSERVGTYRGSWAGVSGYIEDTPDKQSLIEISEETGLAENDIELIGKGEPLIVEDKELGVRWVVHPYLFHIRDRNKIKIDWEHKETRWIKPPDIIHFPTVPMLKKALERVLRSV